MRKLFVFTTMAICLLLLSGISSTAIPVGASPIDIYKTRSELLMEATNHTGVFTPEEAASVWATGLYKRSAALQYTVMTESLKKQYANSLDKWGSNWVTGQSSPSVMSFTITNVTKPDETHAKVNLKFEVGSPSTASKFHDATLWLVRESEFWRIERIWTDQVLSAYTSIDSGALPPNPQSLSL